MSAGTAGLRPARHGLIDAYGRRIDYLRVSVTDRCNLRCAYCLPAHGPAWRIGVERLSDAELVSLLARFAELGVSRLRLTGGEPLVRPGLPSLVAAAVRLPGVAEVSLSTNGVLLAGACRDLAAAGLRRVNVSLDSLRPERFRDITRFGDLKDVLAGIESARRAGLAPVKVNMVVARGINEDEVRSFADWAASEDLHVRFIELMPMGETGFFSKERWVPLAEMMDLAGPLEPAGTSAPAGCGPAVVYRRPGGRGTIGFIAALSAAFCASCNRMRLGSDGTLHPCLDGSGGMDLAGPLRQGAAPEALAGLIRSAARAKPEGHCMLGRAKAGGPGPRFMCQIGG